MALMKMMILSFKSFDNPMDLMKPRLFTAMFNPSSYKVEYNLNKDKKEASGTDNQSAPVNAVSLKKMSFDFLIDGTGANGEKRVVLVETKKFESVVMPEKGDLMAFNAATQAKLELPKLLLIWGTFVFSCEVENFSFNYTLFNQLGIPLRATISASFIEVKPVEKLNDLFSLADSEGVETVSNITSFLSTAFAVTGSVEKSVEMARTENLSSLRQNSI
jgi:hypothetical protein